MRRDRARPGAVSRTSLPDLVDALGNPLGNDFIAFWSAPRLPLKASLMPPDFHRASGGADCARLSEHKASSAFGVRPRNSNEP
jgi:hypothetical protein